MSSYGGLVVHAAAGNSAASTMYVPQVSEIGVEIAVPSEILDGKTPTTQVPTTTIDKLFTEYRMTHADLTLIDTEGHDHEVLRGAEGTLRTQALKVVVFEYGGQWCVQPHQSCVRLEPIVRFLATFGYQCWWLGNDGDVAHVSPSCTDVSTRRWSNLACMAAPELVAEMKNLETKGARHIRHEMRIRHSRSANAS